MNMSNQIAILPRFLLLLEWNAMRALMDEWFFGRKKLDIIFVEIFGKQYIDQRTNCEAKK